MKKKKHKFYKYINQSIQNCKNKIVQTRFDTNHELEKSLLKEKIEKVVRFMKDDLVEEIMTQLAAWRPKSYLKDDNHKNKRIKRHKKVS